MHIFATKTCLISPHSDTFRNKMKYWICFHRQLKVPHLSVSVCTRQDIQPAQKNYLCFICLMFLVHVRQPSWRPLLRNKCTNNFLLDFLSCLRELGGRGQKQRLNWNQFLHIAEWLFWHIQYSNMRKIRCLFEPFDHMWTAFWCGYEKLTVPLYNCCLCLDWAV